MTFYAAVILLLLVMDPLGGIPFFISALKNVPEHRKKKVILRELLIALALMILFMFQGTKILKLLSISGPSLTIAGGIILLLIAIKMIFPSKDEFMENVVGNEPLIVPLAIPYVSGPSALITVTLIMSRNPTAGRSGFWRYFSPGLSPARSSSCARSLSACLVKGG